MNTSPDSYQQFEQFMQSYQDMVFSTAARLLASREQAEDIAQEVFLKAYEQFDRLHGSDTVGGWLKTVTTHLALNHLTRHRKRWRLFSELRSDADESGVAAEFDGPAMALQATLPDSLLDSLHGAQCQQLLEQALQQLPDHQRVPLVLFHFEEMSYQQIAEQLRVSLAKIKIDILRGRLALARQLSALNPVLNHQPGLRVSEQRADHMSSQAQVASQTAENEAE